MVKPSQVVGLQFGDEGKGKVVDILAEDHDVVVRYQGGGNAGHTILIDGEKYVLHACPSGVLRPGVFNTVAHGCAVNPIDMWDEISGLVERGVEVSPENLRVSGNADLVAPDARVLDAAMDIQTNSIGSTIAGIGPTYALKMLRIPALKVEDLTDMDKVNRKLRIRESLVNVMLSYLVGDEESIRDMVHVLGEKGQSEFFDARNNEVDCGAVYAALEKVREEVIPFIGRTRLCLNEAYDSNQRILLEGAQGAGLDIDFGTLPFVTSSHSSGMGYAADTGLGVPVHKIGVLKAYMTRVGEGPFPTELSGEEGERLRELGGEFGATTGRPRRCGWIDVVMASHYIGLLGIDGLALTKLDILSGLDEIKICTGYEHNGELVPSFSPTDLEGVKPVYKSVPGWSEGVSGIRKYDDLPPNAKEYVRTLEALLGKPVSMVSTGPGRDDVAYKK